MEKELQLIGVNKKYKLENKQTFQALYDINVEFDKGELVSIVGESGSGKSTLMNLIGGLDSDFTGTIISGGENLKKLTDKQLDKYRKNKIGFVFQSFNLISHLSILDNVTLALTLSNVSEKEKVEKATKILKRVGLESQIKKKPTQLSGGQKQRVAIARALINDPEIIIADEPTGALDSDTSMQILEILKEIADSGKLVIMVTHSEKVASISSRVVEIADGRIISDTLNEKYQKTTQESTSNPQEEILQPLPASTRKGKKSKNSKDKQNLSLWSAIRLSIHNMWASKTKNFLMAFGVAIGIGSLILMMCFSSGITDFINDTMKSYSDPTIVTISKKGDSDKPFGSFDYNPFDEDSGEITTLYDDINKYLKDEKGYDFEVSSDNTYYGFNLLSIFSDAKVSYSPSGDFNYSDAETLNISYVYTIPPYYTEKNVIEGEMSSTPSTDANGYIKKNSDGLPEEGGGFMFTKTIVDLFGGEEALGKKVEISFTVPITNAEGKTENFSFDAEDTICGIMDTSVMSQLLVVYVDYDYLKLLFKEKGQADFFAPTTIYVQTPSEEITDAINEYLASTNAYTGSIEDQLAGLFNSLSSVIGTSLIVISCISLLVSAMMILVVLYMSVSERTKEIGVLKSIGARRKDIKRIFTSESLLIGILSGIFGIIFSLILAGIISIVLSSLIGIAPISFRWWYFAVAIGVSILISMLSGLYPASKAAKLDPVESLRRE
ncbi:MAG: ATP-binding cassette domain-containing protein [Clostridia bacterium]|nr:ATP-binding cassette domain-containing protein [Clostridia bacterium]